MIDTKRTINRIFNNLGIAFFSVKIISKVVSLYAIIQFKNSYYNLILFKGIELYFKVKYTIYIGLK